VGTQMASVLEEIIAHGRDLNSRSAIPRCSSALALDRVTRGGELGAALNTRSHCRRLEPTICL
jgi:hypothetical protein